MKAHVFFKLSCNCIVFPNNISRDKTMDDTLMYIPNYDKQHYPFQYIKIQLFTVPKVFKLQGVF